MQRRVSPLFAAIAIVVALAVGVIWFMMRYRAYEAREAEIARAMQAQRDQAIRSGRFGREMMLYRARSQAFGRGGRPQSRRAQRGRAP